MPKGQWHLTEYHQQILVSKEKQRGLEKTYGDLDCKVLSLLMFLLRV